MLPVNFYTQWYRKIDLHNLLRFLELRMDAHAQWEIREYAELIATIVERWVPHTWKAFRDFRLNQIELSAAAADVCRRGERHSGLSQREWTTLRAGFGRGD